ncbi:hypothetical protein L249_7436 [Ophiocordyceps polyrhachis-furcata BCC 54312]|uniref:Uncharacterized protein n=1 Tax=Ophiocordyceps polyrhachis-furcata BCC 54312 TaxID=1330021 RepID=A0A367LBC5_9HYPO|nr:hypothetical protein L249_7436 [Ophiocordyceps polyrhachis-furcata BCC 54312]
MLTRRLIVFLKKARLACSLTYPTFLPSYGPYGPYGPAITYSLCNVRRPRAGYGRPGVTLLTKTKDNSFSYKDFYSYIKDSVYC